MDEDVNLLLYGRDPGLLHTRGLILEASGYRVSVATGFSEVQRAFAGTHIDLLILCHTLPHEESSKARALSISRWNATKCIVLNPGYSCSHMEALCEPVDCCAEPAKLILTVGRIVGAPVTHIPISIEWAYVRYLTERLFSMAYAQTIGCECNDSIQRRDQGAILVIAVLCELKQRTYHDFSQFKFASVGLVSGCP